MWNLLKLLGNTENRKTKQEKKRKYAAALKYERLCRKAGNAKYKYLDALMDLYKPHDHVIWHRGSTKMHCVISHILQYDTGYVYLKSLSNNKLYRTNICNIEKVL